MMACDGSNTMQKAWLGLAISRVIGLGKWLAASVLPYL